MTEPGKKEFTAAIDRRSISEVCDSLRTHGWKDVYGAIVFESPTGRFVQVILPGGKRFEGRKISN